MEVKIKAGGRIWIELSQGSSIGQGKISLLEKASSLGSLRQAAIEMGISYRQAWYKINQMNSEASEPLLILTRGGKEGGSAVLTDFGKKIIEEYYHLQSDFNNFLENHCTKL
jgi:molybdate transport system regulatory protein